MADLPIVGAHGMRPLLAIRRRSAKYGLGAGNNSVDFAAMKTKDNIRRAVWDSLKEHCVARFPGVEGRIPNFIGAEACARLLASTSCWRSAKVIKINPDSPQRAIRQKALMEGKTVYMLRVSENQRFDDDRYRFRIRQLLADIDKIKIFQIDPID